MVPHALAVKHAVQKQKCLDQFPDVVFLLWAPCDTGVLNARLVQDQIVGVESRFHPIGPLLAVA
jgi:hypothetical protein